MRIKGQGYNFGRCVRVVFYKSNSTIPLYTIIHAPELNRENNVAMDMVITDMPSSSAKDKPGYQATLSIYNPSKQLLDVIISGATWISDYIDVMDKGEVKASIQQMKKQKNGAMQRYYDSRVRATIEAGYVVDGKPDFTRLICGYVNGSSFSHKGQDDILTLGIYDIPFSDEPITAMQTYSAAQILEATDEERHQMSEALFTEDNSSFDTTWYRTFEKYIRKYETERIPDAPKTIEDLLTTKNNSLAPLKNVDIPQSSFMTVRVSPQDRDSNTWFNIVFTSSSRAWHSARMGQRNSSGGVTNPQLSYKLMHQIMPEGNVTGYNLHQMLDSLCALAETPVSWERVVDNVSKNTYLIFPVGETKTYVRGEYSDIQIWNYQNLLESPSVDGGGRMTVKMIFNPKCQCLRTLALMLTSSIGDTDVTRDVASFQSSVLANGQMVGSMTSQGNQAAFGVTQINGATMLAAQRKGKADANLKGYMFNVGMPIIKVEHRLSTHKADWTTTVQTVPTISGLNYGAKK